MTTQRRIHTVLIAALVALGLTLAAAVPSASAQSGAPRIDGKRLNDCNGRHADAFSLYTRGVACRRALRLATDAAIGDRLCPRGWKGREGVHLQGPDGRRGHHELLARCSRKGQLFVYHFPVG